MGSNAALSSSTATTLPARRQSSWLKRAEAGADLQHAVSPPSLASALAAGLKASMKLPHGLAEMKAVAAQRSASILAAVPNTQLRVSFAGKNRKYFTTER